MWNQKFVYTNLTICVNCVKVTNEKSFPHLEASTHFMTRQYYQDVTWSCHLAISPITYIWDNFPQQPCHLNLTGTDCAETFWSKIGQCVGNHHNYTMSTSVGGRRYHRLLPCDPLATFPIILKHFIQEWWRLEDHVRECNCNFSRSSHKKSAV